MFEEVGFTMQRKRRSILMSVTGRERELDSYVRIDARDDLKKV